MANGNNSKLQLGFEDTYGTLPAMTRQIMIKSESFKFLPTKKDIGLLTGNRGKGASYLMSKKSEGGFGTLAFPDDVGFYLTNTFGIESSHTLVATTDGAYKTVFTLSNPNTTKLPSFAATVDRGISVKAYTGCNIDSLSFSAQPEDYLNLDIGIKFGKDEVAGTINSLLSPSPLKPFKFSQSSVKINSTIVANITSVKFDMQNALSSYQTTSTGYYSMEPEVGAREVKIDCEVVYATENDTIRESYFKTDYMLALELAWTSEDMAEDLVPYSLKFLLPNCQVTDASPVISDAGTIKQTLSFVMVDTGTGEPISAELVNTMATKYKP